MKNLNNFFKKWQQPMLIVLPLDAFILWALHQFHSAPWTFFGMIVAFQMFCLYAACAACAQDSADGKDQDAQVAADGSACAGDGGCAGGGCL